MVVSSPPSRTVPDVGRSSVPRMLRSVLLPLPDGPTIATDSPDQIARLTPRSACTGDVDPYCFTTLRSSTTGDSVVPALIAPAPRLSSRPSSWGCPPGPCSGHRRGPASPPSADGYHPVAQP